MKQTIFAIGFIFALALNLGCESQVQTDAFEVQPQEKGEVGPFTVSFTNEVFDHTFTAKINQSEGKVEYFTLPTEHGEVELTDAALQFTGCEKDQIQYQLFFFPDAERDEATIVSIGQKVSLVKGKREIFLFFVTGISDCKRVTSRLKLTKISSSKPPQPPKDKRTSVSIFSQSKSLKCSRSDGAEFQMSYPNIKIGSFDFTPGTICYGEKQPGQTTFKYKNYSSSSQFTYVNGPNQAIQIYENSGPVAYVEYGYNKDYNSDPLARGKLVHWYDMYSPSFDMSCVMYKEAWDMCK